MVCQHTMQIFHVAVLLIFTSWTKHNFLVGFLYSKHKYTWTSKHFHNKNIRRAYFYLLLTYIQFMVYVNENAGKYEQVPLCN